MLGGALGKNMFRDKGAITLQLKEVGAAHAGNVAMIISMYV